MAGTVAVFVKTPGLSPIKTRLARDLGVQDAEKFYRLSVAAVREVCGAAPDLKAYWAVAEREGLNAAQWPGFALIGQGEGSLGSRLNRVYSELLSRHSAVLLIGADSPQLTPEVLLQAGKWLNEKRGFVIGPAEDGGFYLLGGNLAIPSAVWEEVPYSEGTTLQELETRLMALGPSQRLETMVDVDTAADLAPLARALERLPHCLPAQADLLAWLTDIGALVRPVP